MPHLPSTPSIPLNAIDCSFLAVERHARSRGLPGIPVHLHVNFRGRLDLSQLQDAADRLAARWPLITARLVRSPRPAWAPTGARRCHIRQQSLESDSEADLLRAVQRIGEDPFDLQNEDPVRLIVLHRPGGDDVLTMQFSHALMDAHGAVCLLQQLLDPTRIPPVADPVAAPADVVGQLLAKTPFRDRMRAVRRMMRLSRQFQPVTLPRLEKKRPRHPSRGRVTLRWIDETRAAALRERLERYGPYANLTLAVLASGCRALSRHIRGPLGPRSAYVIVLPYNLRHGPLKRFPFHNIATRVSLVARPAELGDRDGLVRLFASQMRAQIAENTTVAALQLSSVVGELEHWAPWLAGRLLRGRPRSLHGSSLGEIFESGRTALGATVDYCWLTVPFLPLFGVSLNLVKAGGRLLAVFLYSPHNLSDDQASQLLDEWIEDLCRP